MELDPSLTRKIAELARLRLSKEETSDFTVQLTSILGYVESLQAVDLRGPDGKEVDPLIHPRPMAQPLREDQARPRDWDSGVSTQGYQVPPVV